MQISCKPCSNPASQSTDLLTVFVAKGKLTGMAKQVDESCGGIIAELIAREEFKAKLGETAYFPTTNSLKATRLLVVGTGASSEISLADYDKLIAICAERAARTSSKSCCLLLDDVSIKTTEPVLAFSRAAQLFEVKSYRYSATLSKPKPPTSLRTVVLQGANTAANRSAIEAGRSVALGINTARNLGDLPANICTPSYLAAEARKLGRKHQSLSVSVLDEKKMQQLGMGALLSVTAGTEQPARLIVIEHNGGAKNAAPHVLVGKGITFDTGGISIKPSARMEEMKFDMCGAASVMGTMNAIADMALPLNVVGIIAAAENMPSGRATKPGDVVKSMSGQTIEVANTDAEGRLVLCDALTYAAKFKPASVIDIATLTGACIVALGNHAAALYSNQDDFADELLAAGQRCWDRVWHMPLWDDYQKQIDSSYADICNTGGPGAGSITAACFLSRFTKEYRWAHLDIAGAAWTTHKAGATGRPVGLLCEYLKSKVA